MCDERPFAWCRQVGEEVCIEADDGFVVARFALDVSSQSEYTKDKINSAVAARERKAAARALRGMHDDLVACGREWQAYGHVPTHADYLRQIELRAAALEGGAT